MDLQDKKALITGGTSGMGIAVALSMAEKGASVIITGRDETRGASTVEEIRAGGHDAQFIAADFSEMSEVRRVADAAGEIDVLVNCAGFAALAPTADTDEAAFDGLFQINVKAPFFLVAALAPKIAARGGQDAGPDWKRDGDPHHRRHLLWSAQRAHLGLGRRAHHRQLGRRSALRGRIRDQHPPCGCASH